MFPVNLKCGHTSLQFLFSFSLLQYSTEEHIMSLKAKQSAAMHFAFRPLIAKLICFHLWYNLAFIPSGKYTHSRNIETYTHTVCGFALTCILKSGHLLF